MDKAKQDAYVDGWQAALESIMSAIEVSVRDVVNQFVLPDAYAEKEPESKLIVPEEKKIITL